MVESHQMLTVPEVAAFLRVSKPTVYGMINRGELPCGHFGRQIRVYKPDILALCRQQIQEMTEEQ